MLYHSNFGQYYHVFIPVKCIWLLPMFFPLQFEFFFLLLPLALLLSHFPFMCTTHASRAPYRISVVIIPTIITFLSSLFDCCMLTMSGLGIERCRGFRDSSLQLKALPPDRNQARAVSWLAIEGNPLLDCWRRCQSRKRMMFRLRTIDGMPVDAIFSSEYPWRSAKRRRTPRIRHPLLSRRSSKTLHLPLFPK